MARAAIIGDRQEARRYWHPYSVIDKRKRQVLLHVADCVIGDPPGGSNPPQVTLYQGNLGDLGDLPHTFGPA